MDTLLHEAHIFGNIQLYQFYLNSEIVYIEQYEHYQKRSFRNRYPILTAQGPITLSIPLQKGKNEQLAIKDVKIAYNQDWVKTHLQTIRSAYGKSPYFEHYFSYVEHIFNKKYTFLFDLNIDSLKTIIKLLRLNIKLELTSEYIADTNKNHLDLRSFIWATPTTHSIEKPNYAQVWESKFGFTNNLCILDLLFCCGPEASLYLKQKSLTSFNTTSNQYE